jgi:glycosyltransferase involved in cell wall biosynthesis
VLIAYNEESRLSACLDRLTWADEIVVVDSGSTDATRTIAGQYTPHVVEIPWRGFGPQKQAAVELAAHNWVFVVDCDELVTPELAGEIMSLLAQPEIKSAYDVPRRTFIGNKEIKYCGWYPDRTVRLFDRTKARFSESIVHEVVVVNGRQSDCRNDLLHFSFASINDMLPKMQRYSELAARQMFSQGRRCRVFDLTVRPLAAFFKTYLLKAGLLDGVEGLAICVTTAVLAFLKYVRLREMQLEKNIEINS